jgi:hypothetical protein
VFGSSFNTNGLGGVLTCGVTGMGAGLSHSPVSTEGRERYVFFAFPHCAVDETGKLGAISRPNRPGESCACGAMAAVSGPRRAPRPCRVGSLAAATLCILSPRPASSRRLTSSHLPALASSRLPPPASLIPAVPRPAAGRGAGAQRAPPRRA